MSYPGSPSPDQQPQDQPSGSQPPAQPPYQPPYGQPPYGPPPAQRYGQPPMMPANYPGQNKPNGRLSAFRKRRPVLSVVLATFVGLIVACVACTILTQVLGSLPGHGGGGSTSTESVAQYQQSAVSVTTSDLAKAPNAYKGKVVTFQAVIVSFVLDSNGNTVAANVVSTTDYTSDVLLKFSPSVAIQNINKGDSITVWGQGEGALAGKNAFGATITECEVQEMYLHDSTTNYNDYTFMGRESHA